jgi:hypothetical protein|tara:strand:- start:4675 stop:5475 length:801 start_codon:yes stop_codon:yes gene_type:complete
MRLHLVTCTDWNYRRWTTTLINSLDDSWTEKFVIAVGEGDWEAYGAQLGVTIIPQQFNHAMDPIRWCQNVRMRHLRALIEDCDWLLQIDSDVRQNLIFDINHVIDKQYQDPRWGNPKKKGIFFANYKHTGKTKGSFHEEVNPRFRINAGWCLYKNCKQNRDSLEQIQRAFDFEYDNEDNWDQLQLLKHYEKDINILPFKYVCDGATGYYPHAGWYHCKGPKKKTITSDWHILSEIPKPIMTEEKFVFVQVHDKWVRIRRVSDGASS